MINELVNYSKEALVLDEAIEVDRIIKMLRQIVLLRFHRQGAVVGIDGGVDSAVVLALSALAFGVGRVVGVMVPEREAGEENLRLAREHAEELGIRTVSEDITASLESCGCYQRRDEAIQKLFPRYKSDWKARIVLPSDLTEQGAAHVFYLVMEDPRGVEHREKLTLNEFRQITAASSFKQRIRMSMLYYHADLNNYAVVGSANKNEHELGIFVKYGDNGGDVNPIAHLFKTQVYQLAGYLGGMEEIQKRSHVLDASRSAGSQEESVFEIPFSVLDPIWMGYELGVPENQVAMAVDLETDQVIRIICNIISRKRTTDYLRASMVDVNNFE